MKPANEPQSSSFAHQPQDIEHEAEWFFAIITGDTTPGLPTLTFRLLATNAIYDAIAGVAEAFRSQRWISRIAGEQGFERRDEYDDGFQPVFATIVDARQRLVVGIQLMPTFLVLMPAFNDDETARIRQHQQVLETEAKLQQSQPGGEVIAHYLRRQSEIIGLHLADSHYRHHHEMKAIKSFISAGGTLEWFAAADRNSLN
ncbi:hypothetical protein BTJ39_13920 [Izhakiella australiensis]|uniref:Uncharacterized protein n=1 Tax=Izhakiella australiensis TaxID=1926881 RepID=A0A1S8YJW2_9GAMM|nr:hypothetical protein [Izhakiella australiensis]OON39374.1 hypothetical protein BTJ39_13920 [Izhakiella australiensis]